MKVSVVAQVERFLYYIFLIVILFACFSLEAQSEKIDPWLQEAMSRTDEAIPVVVTLVPVEPIESGYWGEKPSPNEVEYHLKKRSLELQWQMRQLVNDWASTNAGISQIKYFWNANAMMAQMTPELILELAELPEVTKILFDRRVQLTYARGEPGAQADFTYGLQKLGIPQLRQEYSELTGQGVVVGILDTGIDANHPELKGKVVAWKDFIQDKDQPYDDNSHGTHVAGTIAGSGVGGTQIGVAPGVKLVIGKMLSGRGGGSLSQILRSMEWIANPDRSAAGSLRPRVVSNSWGGPMGDDLRTDPFVQAVNAWVQLEIFPSFAAGNEGPRQGSVGSPGGVPEAFAVGATDQNDQVTSFSSRGPVVVTGTDGKRLSLMKPEISAPGKDVYSTVPGGRYASYSGTSMATPHLSGVVALLYQANPSLKVADVKKILMQSAVDMGPEGKDNSYGAGRADVIRAIEVVQKGSF